jgi:O-antigen/teichoic acid export membrane protein
VILLSLGVTDFGIYNVVGGFVAMFSVVSSSLSSSISRYLTYELGHGDRVKLNQIFSTSVHIQMIAFMFIILLGETLGVWFLNTQMNIPIERMYAANWVLQCSLLSFGISLLVVPFNALVIAHEKMGTFAYIGIFEAVSKLIIAYLLFVSPVDRLIFYALLLTALSASILLIYALYSRCHFEECRYMRVRDWKLMKEMSNFAGWGFFSNTAYIFNTQGVNILINFFFGVTLNAARGVAVQVESAVVRFVNDFMTALNPQITISYAKGDRQTMNSLVIRGAKFSMYLFLLLSLPILMETDFILHLWLVEVPEHTANFIRLSIIGTLMMSVGNTGYTACMATGYIKRYSLWITLTGCTIFPLTWIAFLMGMPVESAYVIFILVYFVVDMVRLWIMKSLLDFPVRAFLKEVFLNLLIMAALAVIVPLLFVGSMPQSLLRFIIVSITSVCCSMAAIWVFGLSMDEKSLLLAKLETIRKKYK